MQDRMKTSFTQSIQTQIASADVLLEPIARAGELLTQTVLHGQRLFCCGENSAALVAQYFADLFIGGLSFERPPFPALAITQPSHEECLAKRVSALGQSGDVLLVCSHQEDSPYCSRAIEAALARGMLIIALTGDQDRDIEALLGPEDVAVRIPSIQPMRIFEQLFVISHLLCQWVEFSMFPQEIEEP